MAATRVSNSSVCNRIRLGGLIQTSQLNALFSTSEVNFHAGPAILPSNSASVDEGACCLHPLGRRPLEWAPGRQDGEVLVICHLAEKWKSIWAELCKAMEFGDELCSERCITLGGRAMSLDFIDA